jgi:bifunctional UDP-N-acetylglucosamine pyrophosphorylase / glucosamine-1-phosphate N-acetyltransferase
MRWAVAVLAAGKGTRMRSDLPKVLHLLGGRVLLDHVLDTALAVAGPEAVVVVIGHGAEAVRAHVAGRGVVCVVQEPQLGTADAVRVALGGLEPGLADALVVLSGDVPLLRRTTVARLQRRLDPGPAAAILTAVLEEPAAYGRVLRDDDGSVAAIVEASDATPEELRIREVNAGIYAFRVPPLAAALASVATDNSQREYYLTDVVADLRGRGLEVAAEVLDEPMEMLGVNTRHDLADLEALLHRRSRAG